MTRPHACILFYIHPFSIFCCFHQFSIHFKLQFLHYLIKNSNEWIYYLFAFFRILNLNYNWKRQNWSNEFHLKAFIFALFLLNVIEFKLYLAVNQLKNSQPNIYFLPIKNLLLICYLPKLIVLRDCFYAHILSYFMPEIFIFLNFYQ